MNPLRRFRLFRETTSAPSKGLSGRIPNAPKLGIGLMTAACFVGMLPSPAAHAATATTTFAVTANVQSTCTIGATALSFGTYTGATTAASSALSVTCTNSTPYTIGLSAGLASGATVTTRQMVGPSSDVLNYALFSDSSLTNNWTDAGGTGVVGQSGTGSLQTFPVFGSIPASQFVTPGSYGDTITATLTY